MSGRRVLTATGLLWPRRVSAIAPPRRSLHNSVNGRGLLWSTSKVKAATRRPWPMGAYFIHNVPAVRTISFARVLPKLATKLIRVPAMFGGAAIAGLAYIQYQANQAGTYAMDLFRRAGDSTSSMASSMASGARDIAQQTWNGWEKTRSETQENMPEWLAQLFGRNDGHSSGQGGGEQPNEPQQSKSNSTVAAAATGAAFGYSQSPEEDDRSAEEAAQDDQMMVLTKKMIEIRSILQQVGQSSTLTLPSIVVIGSQSSGKSSVLEAIVGHEFLPKGSNMVTRRPIELTLVNTPDATAEYGEFPAIGLGKITDFAQIQRTLMDLNLAVPSTDCVSDDPIQLSIYSPHVPDLSLIDLPGYIQVVGSDQPPELKQKISDLCDKYIQAPNIILAISAADVDLANSTALRASRRVDPRGERTIGVITKMDLVEPSRGASILQDRKYPLRLGYVGVVSRVPPQSGLFSRGSGNITSIVTRNENSFFSSHPLEYGPDSEVALGTITLRKKLMHVLESTMASSLQTTTDSIRQELEEATYEFKVQYNDRPLSAESHLAESLDAFKHSFKQLAESFGRPQVRDLLKAELDQRVLDLLAQRYWNKPVIDLSRSRPDPNALSTLTSQGSDDNPYWRRQLDASTSALTKLGIGRLATTIVADSIQVQIDSLVNRSTFAAHPFARDAIRAAADSILSERFYSTSDQVENCIKPYKYEIELDETEWTRGRASVINSLRRELKDVQEAQRNLAADVGGKRKMKDVLSFVDRVQRGEIVLEGDGSSGAGGFSAALLKKGRDAAFLRTRAELLDMRLMALKSRGCATSSAKYNCPEVFLDVVAEKLTSTAVLFLNVELLSEFYYHFPRELDSRLGRSLGEKDLERFAREDPKVAAHLDVIRRKEMLELVLEKCEGLRGLEAKAAERGQERRTRKGEKARNRGWFF